MWKVIIRRELYIAENINSGVKVCGKWKLGAQNVEREPRGMPIPPSLYHYNGNFALQRNFSFIIKIFSTQIHDPHLVATW